MIEVDGDGPCGLHIGCGATSPDDCPIESGVLADLARVVVAPELPKARTLTPDEVAFEDAVRQLEAMAAALPVAAPCARPASRPRLPSWKRLPSR